jgi:hypothetical protein
VRFHEIGVVEGKARMHRADDFAGAQNDREPAGRQQAGPEWSREIVARADGHGNAGRQARQLGAVRRQ